MLDMTTTLTEFKYCYTLTKWLLFIVQAKRAMHSMCKAAREHCKRDYIIQEDSEDTRRADPLQWAFKSQPQLKASLKTSEELS